MSVLFFDYFIILKFDNRISIASGSEQDYLFSTWRLINLLAILIFLITYQLKRF